MNTKLSKKYNQKIEELAKLIATLKTRGQIIVLLELILFIIIICLIIFYAILKQNQILLVIAFLLVFLYFYLRKLDFKNDTKLSDLKSLLVVYKDEVDYQNGIFLKFRNGESYLDPNHRYAYDLDIFGDKSLFQRINRTISTGGNDYLAKCLLNTISVKGLSKYSFVLNRQKTISNLTTKELFLSKFKSISADEPIDTKGVKKAIGLIDTIKVPSYFINTIMLIFVYLLRIAFYVSIILGIMSIVTPVLPIWVGLINLFISVFISKKYFSRINNVLDNLKLYIKKYQKIIRVVTNEKFESNELLEIKESLQKAHYSFDKIERLSQKIDNRSNQIGMILFNSFFMVDFFIVRDFVKLQKLNKINHEAWIDNISKIDALVSMANFALNENKAIFPKIIDENKVIYKTKNIYHPFLGEKAIPNDFFINNREYYIITGANMAGKSTFLRSIGINYVLAINGLPVFADDMEISLFYLFTNMRTKDDLTHGISYFNAELLRLKQLINSLDIETPTLIILDEILKGTNSVDKLNGSRLFLKYISDKNVTGIIATHDLELSNLEKEQPNRFHNYCFEIQLSDQLTYPYKITKSVARNQNATYLLKQLLT